MKEYIVQRILAIFPVLGIVAIIHLLPHPHRPRRPGRHPGWRPGHRGRRRPHPGEDGPGQARLRPVRHLVRGSAPGRPGHISRLQVSRGQADTPADRPYPVDRTLRPHRAGPGRPPARNPVGMEGEQLDRQVQHDLRRACLLHSRILARVQYDLHPGGEAPLVSRPGLYADLGGRRTVAQVDHDAERRGGPHIGGAGGAGYPLGDAGDPEGGLRPDGEVQGSCGAGGADAGTPSGTPRCPS